MRSICSQWLGYSWMCPLLPCLAAHQTGSELPRITVQRSEVRRPHSAHSATGDVCAPLKYNTFDQTAVQHTGTDFYYGVARICSQTLSTCQNIIITLAGSYSNQHFEVVHYELSPAARARHQDSRSSVFYGVHSGHRRPGPGPSAAQPEIII